MNELIQSIYDNPQDWSQKCEYHFFHKSGTSFWVANSYYGFKCENRGEFNWLQKRAAYKAYRWWLANAPIEAFNA